MVDELPNGDLLLHESNRLPGGIVTSTQRVLAKGTEEWHEWKRWLDGQPQRPGRKLRESGVAPENGVMDRALDAARKAMGS